MSDSKYYVSQGYIELPLTESQLEETLEDIKDVAGLVKPHISIKDGKAIFRDQDVKLLDAELFFQKNLPEFKLDRTLIKQILVMGLAIMLMGSFAWWSSGLMAVIVFCFVTVTVTMVVTLVFYLYYKQQHTEQYRRSLYVKAKLIAYLYMVIMQDLSQENSNINENYQHVKKIYAELKDMYRDLDRNSTKGNNYQTPDVFPDGERIDIARTFS